MPKIVVSDLFLSQIKIVFRVTVTVDGDSWILFYQILLFGDNIDRVSSHTEVMYNEEGSTPTVECSKGDVIPRERPLRRTVL